MKSAVLRALSAGVACACLVIAGAAPPAMASTDNQVFRETANPAELTGVWRSRGYGWLLAIKNGQSHFYDEAANLCIEDEEASDTIEELAEGLQISADGHTIRLPLGDLTYQYTFDRIDALPERCRQKPDATPMSVLNAVIDIFSRHYAFFGVRNVDWKALVSWSRGKVTASTTSDELADVVESLISKIDDAHVNLEAERHGKWFVHESGDGPVLDAVAAQAKREGVSFDALSKRWANRYWNRDIGTVLLGRRGRVTANGMIQYGLVGDDIGYFNIRTMEELDSDAERDEDDDLAALEKTMDAAMERFRHVKAVIVDVSMNDGGYDTIARALAGRFAAERTLAYYKYAGDAGDRGKQKPQPIYIEPSERRRFTGPVYLLTSNVTLSAAEIFTLAMRALPNVVHIGEATRGSLSDNLQKPLPNGWLLSLSNEVYLDADGKLWEGKGIPPQVPMQVFSRKDVTRGHVEAVRAVVDMARGKTPLALSRR